MQLQVLLLLLRLQQGISSCQESQQHARQQQCLITPLAPMLSSSNGASWRRRNTEQQK
jgi:hypothetical protein